MQEVAISGGMIFALGARSREFDSQIIPFCIGKKMRGPGIIYLNPTAPRLLVRWSIKIRQGGYRTRVPRFFRVLILVQVGRVSLVGAQAGSDPKIGGRWVLKPANTIKFLSFSPAACQKLRSWSSGYDRRLPSGFNSRRAHVFFFLALVKFAEVGF